MPLALKAERTDTQILRKNVKILQGPYSRTHFNGDEAGKYDVPAGIDKVLEITKHRNVQVLGHCVGSVIIWSALLGGHLDPNKIRCILASQVAFTPIGSKYNKIRGKVYFSNIAEVVGRDLYDVLDEDETFGDKVFDIFVQNVAEAVVPYDEMCKNKICHRCTFLYGLMWEHENMNVLTHSTLHETFGMTNTTMGKHLQQYLREEKLMQYGGGDVYLPGYKWNKDLSKIRVPKTVKKYCNIPTLLFNGTLNSVFKPDNLDRTYAILKKANPDQHYERLQIEGYGHIDWTMGKNGKDDVFPKLMPFINKYAHRNMKANEEAVRIFCDVLLKGKQISLPEGWRDEVRAKGIALKDENENEIDGDEDTDSDSEDETSFTKKVDKSENYENKADNHHCNLHVQRIITVEWRRKIKPDKVELKDPTTYEEVEFDSRSRKRIFYSITDLHLGAYNTKKVEKGLDKLLAFMRKRSHRTFAFIMTGDILEYWYDPHNELPLSLEELRNKWLTGIGVPGMQKFKDMIKEFTEKLNVKVYYVRGNHDGDVTEELVCEIFENRVTFVPEKIVFGIKEGGVTYYVAYEHGHQWDLCNNCFVKNNHYKGHALGYYVARLARTKEYEAGCCSASIQKVMPSILRTLPLDFPGSLAMKLASWTFLNGLITKALFLEVYGHDLDEDMDIVLRDGSKVKVKELLDFPLIEITNDQIGSDGTWDLVKGSLGDFTGLIEQATEDVVILGHSHLLGAYKGTGKYRKNVIYANPGCWTDKCDGKVSVVEVEAPWRGQMKGNGVVQIVRLKDA